MGYIEIIFVLNYLINILVIYSSAIILNRILSVKKVLLSGFIGLIPTVIYLFCDYLIINLLLVVITSLLMSIISFGYKNIIYTLKNAFYMYMSSFPLFCFRIWKIICIFEPSQWNTCYITQNTKQK